jgi:transglutaminase-like putative cysteine protease
MTPQGDTDGLFFSGSALAYLAILMIGRPRQLVPSIAIAVAAVLGGLVLPAALPSTDITATSNSLGPSVSTGVNPMIRLGDDLRQNEKHVALSYSTVSGKPEYLRLVVVSDFFSNSWGPNQPALDQDNRPVDLPRPPGLAVGVTTEREVSYIHVANLLSPWLPVPYPASSITGLTGSWQYIPDSLTVASNLSLARGENYTVSSVVLTPTPEQLLATGSSVPSGFGDFLSLPPDTPGIIASTAEKVTAGESSNYEKALALQEYLRSSPFQYSETAPVSDGYDGTGVEVVAKFLEAHRGYCIHFASAMAVMARELGIPSRMIVGFQPGSPTNNADNTRRLFEVTTQDLHTWPELYFKGIGWVRFEPTPSRGSVPDYANPTVPGVPVIQDPGAVAPGAPGEGQNGGLGPQVDAGPTVVRWLTSGNWSSWLAITGTGVVLVALIFLPAGARTLRRRRRVAALRSGRGTAASAWRELLESSEDVGVTVSPTLTPREAVARLQRVRGMNSAGQLALVSLGEAVEREGYGRPRTAEGGSGVAIAQDLTTVLACFRAGVDSSVNLRATLLPPSLVSRTLRLAGRLT